MGLSSDIRQYMPVEELEEKDLIGKTVAVDTFNYLYQFLSAIRTQNGDLLERNGVVVSHLYGILWKFGRLLANGTKLIFVFDGKPSADKQLILEERREQKEKIMEEIEIAKMEGNEKEVAKLQRLTAKVDNSIIDSTKTLAKFLGISYIDAPEEGEAEAVHLVKTGFADYVATQDYDVIAYGCRSILRNIGVRKGKKFLKINLVDAEKVFKIMEISQDQFLYVAFMTGTDYNYGIKNVGIKRALKIAKQANTNQELVDLLIKNGYVQEEERENVLRELENVMSHFKHPNVVDGSNIVHNSFDKEGLISFLRNLNFNVDRFMPMIDKISAVSNH